MNKYKAVIFDMDGVIFDSERCLLDIWLEVAKRDNIPNMLEVYLKCVGTSDVATKQITLDHFGADFPYDTYKMETSSIYHQLYDHGKLPLKKGVRELLAYLKEANYLIGIASSSRQSVIELQVKEAGLFDYFQHITGGDKLKKSKPEPDIYLMACEGLGVKPSEAIAIEDSYNGIRSAYRAGMTPLMVPDLLPPDEEMKQLAHKIFPDLLEVLNFIMAN